MGAEIARGGTAAIEAGLGQRETAKELLPMLQQAAMSVVDEDDLIGFLANLPAMLARPASTPGWSRWLITTMLALGCRGGVPTTRMRASRARAAVKPSTNCRALR